MWWKGGKFTGIFTYRGRIYTLRNMGGDLHAIVETEPDKLPPDHGPSENGKAADLKDDPLVSRGEGAPMRTAEAPNDDANAKDEGSAGASFIRFCTCRQQRQGGATFGRQTQANGHQ